MAESPEFDAISSASRFLPVGEEGRIWFRSDRRRYDSKPRQHSELVVLLALQGQMRYFLEGTLLTISAGTLLLCHSDQSHFLVEDTDEFDMVVVVAAPTLLDPALHPPYLRKERSEYEADLRVLTGHQVDELVALANTLHRQTEPNSLKLGLSWWLHRAWVHWCSSSPHEMASTHPGVAHALAMIRFDPSLSLDEVAQSAGLSLSRLGQVFRQELGMTMRQYRTAHRLELVERRIKRDPHTSLLNAALDAGFGDYSRFYRAFVAARGMSPRVLYRKNQG